MVVVGVDYDDVLNVRAGPGTEYGIVTTLPPASSDLVVTGEARLLPSSVWYEIEFGTATGWVNAWYLAFPGATDDAASLVVTEQGSIPVASTMLGLGSIVAKHFVDDEVLSTVAVVTEPSVGDFGEVTYDVVGLADDAIKGYRLHIFGRQDGGEGPFSLYAVERTLLCWRGVTSGGLCI